MKFQVLFILIFFVPLYSCGQNNLTDTGITKMDCYPSWKNEQNIIQVLNSSGNHIKKIIGRSVYSRFIKLDTSKSTKCDFQLWSRTKLEPGHFKPERLKSFPCFTLHYYLIKDSDTLNYFDFLVDTLGNPVEHANTFFTFSSPVKLLLGYKKLFEIYFKINHAEAIKIGKKYKFTSKPIFDYDLNNNNFIWTYLDGPRKMVVNAKTGFRKESYEVIRIRR
jgi:hypothetical protein